MAVRRLTAEQPETFAFSNDNEEWAKGQIAKFPEGRQQSAVIPLLWRAQEQHEGWLPEPAIRYVADMLGMPYIRALEVATFYTMFNLNPVGKHFVQLCGTTPCMLRGSDELKEVCRRVIGPESTVSEDGQLSWLEVECLGACVNAPMVQINKDYYEDLTPDGFEALLEKLRSGEEVAAGPQTDRLTSSPLGGPTSLTDENAILRTPRHEEGSVDRASDAVAKGQPETGDERLEEETATEDSAVGDEIKARRDGDTGADAGKTGDSEVEAHIPQGEDRFGDAAAREKSSIESSEVAKGEHAPEGGGAPGATTGDATAERRADSRRPDPGENERIGQEAGGERVPERGEADGTEDRPVDGGQPSVGGDDTTIGLNAGDGDANGALPKEGPKGSVTAAAKGVREATQHASEPGGAGLGEASKAEQHLPPTGGEASPNTGAQVSKTGELRGSDDAASVAATSDQPAAPRKIGSGTSAGEAAEIRAAAREDARAPLVLDAPRGEADDLKRISGIGPKLEELLHSLGFFHFGQLATWTEDQVAWVDEHLEGFNGRIERDDWVGQAKSLHEGDENAFAKRDDEKGDA